MPNKLKGIAAHIFAGLCWGFAAPIVKYAFNEIQPFTFVFLRMILAVLILTPILWPKLKKTRINAKDWPLIIFSGLLGVTLNIGLYFAGLANTSVIDSSIISATTSIFTALAAFLFLREKISKIVAVGITVSFAGTIVIILQPILQSGFFHTGNFFGNMLILFATWAWVAYTIVNKDICKKYDSLILIYIAFFLGAFCFLPLAAGDIFNVGFYLNLTPFALFAIGYETVFATIGAYLAFNWGLKFITATTAGVISYLHPLIAISASIIFLGEKVTTLIIVGALLVFIGLFLSEAKHSHHPLHHYHKRR